jgi:hypothetical protein
MSKTLLLVLCLLAGGSSASAQAAPQGPAASILFAATPHSPLRPGSWERADSVARDIQPTHWKEGALIGGVLGGVGGALLGAWVCGMSESSDGCTGTAVAGGLGGALVVGITGALIGGQISKGQGRPD